MTTVVLFALAAGTGAAVRGAVVHIWPGGHRGTLVVNVAGSLALGLLAGWSGPTVTILGSGALGALTTFSTFAADAAEAAEEGGLVRGAVYVGAILTLGMAAAFTGIAIST
ncbi:MAG: CrcB family protein [Acidimicrobiales bacterium]|jgi:CrcB protein|nr:CrcB family protein [Acidimicrobiales bacterium]